MVVIILNMYWMFLLLILLPRHEDVDVVVMGYPSTEVEVSFVSKDSDFQLRKLEPRFCQSLSIKSGDSDATGATSSLGEVHISTQLLLRGASA